MGWVQHVSLLTGPQWRNVIDVHLLSYAPWGGERPHFCPALENAVRNTDKDLACQVTAILLQTGVNTEARLTGDPSCPTALSYSTSKGRADLIRLLLAYGADPYARNNKGGNALGHACCIDWTRRTGGDHPQSILSLFKPFVWQLHVPTFTREVISTLGNPACQEDGLQWHRAHSTARIPAYLLQRYPALSAFC